MDVVELKLSYKIEVDLEKEYTVKVVRYGGMRQLLQKMKFCLRLVL